MMKNNSLAILFWGILSVAPLSILAADNSDIKPSPVPRQAVTLAPGVGPESPTRQHLSRDIIHGPKAQDRYPSDDEAEMNGLWCLLTGLAAFASGPKS